MQRYRLQEVYLPVADDHGIDILVKSKSGTPDDYQEIQVKAKEKNGLFAAVKCPNPRPNYWFVFYVKSLDKFWVVNSVDFVSIASQVKNGKHAGVYSLTVTSKNAPAPVSDFSMIP